MEKKFSFFIAQIGFAIVVVLCFNSAKSNSHQEDPFKLMLEGNLDQWRDGILNTDAEAPGPSDSGSLVLAESRTKRPDILNGFKHYQGGWDIANKHYWASVGFTGAAGFILAVLWFVFFGVALVVHYCCNLRIEIKGKDSRGSQVICLILLILFTCAAAVGCIVLSVGQDKFHGEAVDTLDYVVNQSDYTVQTLVNVTEYLSLAKTVNIAQSVLPQQVKDDIDNLNVKLQTAAETLKQKTNENSGKIRKVFDSVRKALIGVAVVILLVSLLGLILTFCGHKHAIHIFIISGWLLVAATFLIFGVFLILSSAISDTCMAMEQWVDNPHAETALSNILPCVDQRTTNQTLIKSKQVITDLVNIINGFIGTFANSASESNSYNQSGPPMPYLCFPYDSQLLEQKCYPSPQVVSLADAPQVWQNYTCTVSEYGFCNSVGRITPMMYGQLVGVVNIGYGLEHYAPPLLSLQDCNFVRDTFRDITTDHCPPLEDHLQMVNAGLGLISAGVMLCLVLWVIYANRPQREEVFVQISSKIRASFNSKSSCITNDVESGHATPSRVD